MTQPDWITFTLPAVWASYLVNGDPDSLCLEAGGTEERALIDHWLAFEELGPCLGCSEQPFFTWRPDGPSQLGAECLEFWFERCGQSAGDHHKYPQMVC